MAKGMSWCARIISGLQLHKCRIWLCISVLYDTYYTIHAEYIHKCAPPHLLNMLTPALFIPYSRWLRELVLRLQHSRRSEEAMSFSLCRPAQTPATDSDLALHLWISERMILRIEVVYQMPILHKHIYDTYTTTLYHSIPLYLQ
jgi:hypothetical protein